jgi:hypothetical protein
MIFENLEAAQNGLEPWQVGDEDFVVYDAMGRLLVAETDGNRTALSLAETEPSATAVLEEKLRSYLRYRGDAAADSEAGLATLVGVAAKYAKGPFSIRARSSETVCLGSVQGEARAGDK